MGRVTSYGPECLQVHQLLLLHHEELDQLRPPVTSSWKAGQRLAHLAGSTRISTSKPRVGIRRGLQQRWMLSKQRSTTPPRQLQELSSTRRRRWGRRRERRWTHTS